MKVLALVFVMGVCGIAILLLFQVLVYTVVVGIYHNCIKIAALFNKKAALWVKGRTNWYPHLQQNFQPSGKPVIWFHCASLGEFEQGRPVIDQIRNDHPNHYILLTFYSPSGYEIRKGYPQADYVAYLPADTATNASKFINLVKPEIVVFVKYEFWYHYLNTLAKANIPVILISGIFRKKQLFFKWYGRLHKSMLRKFKHIFVQNEASLNLLKSIKIENVTVSFDTRYDRVNAIAAAIQPIPEFETFSSGFNVIVAGSTWPKDERILAKAFYKNLVHNNFKLIIVPHNIDSNNLKRIKKRFKKFSLIYTELNKVSDADIIGKRVMIVDTMGMLSSLYQYGDVSYIGGGFNKGIHNILEAAVFGKPILMGPKYKNFDEAVGLVKQNAALPIRDEDELLNRINLMNQFQFIYNGASEEAIAFIASHTGGSKIIVDYINQQIA